MWEKQYLKLSMVAALAVLGLAGVASAHAPAVTVTGAWSPPPPSGAPTAAGYLTITNNGEGPDKLLGADTPAAASLTLHLMSNTGGIMRMRPVPEGLVIAAHASVTLDPNGYHLMFEGLKAPFKAGQQIPIVLHFQHAGALKVKLAVGSSPKASMAGMDMH